MRTSACAHPVTNLESGTGEVDHPSGLIATRTCTDPADRCANNLPIDGDTRVDCTKVCFACK
jgi:hypothetical protein